LAQLEVGEAVPGLDGLVDRLADVDLAREPQLLHDAASPSVASVLASSPLESSPGVLRPCFSSHDCAMPSGSSSASSVKSKSARSSSEGSPMAPAIACTVTVSIAT